MADKLEQENNGLNKAEIIRYAIIFFFTIDILPAIPGVPLLIVFQSSLYIEIIYIIFGVVALLAVLFRSRRRDSKNWKENKTLSEDKTTSEFKTYRVIQWLMVACGVLALGLSLAFYFIGRAAFPA